MGLANFNRLKGFIMSELSREDFQQAFKDQARQSEQHARDQLSAINSLAEEIRGMASAVLTQQRGHKNGGNGEVKWAMGLIFTVIFAIGGLSFQFTSNVKEQLSSHASLPGHPGMMEKFGKVEAHIDHLEIRGSEDRARLDKEVSDIDESLRREIMLSGQGADESRSDLDKKIQMEIGSVEAKLKLIRELEKTSSE